MRTRAKMQIAASDRARRPDVPGHILFYQSCDWKEIMPQTDKKWNMRLTAKRSAHPPGLKFSVMY